MSGLETGNYRQTGNRRGAQSIREMRAANEVDKSDLRIEKLAKDTRRKDEPSLEINSGAVPGV